MPKSYNYHKPSPDGLQKINRLRKAFSDLHDLVEEVAPPSRERSICLTTLENSAMWGIKAVVVNDPESVVEEPLVDA